MDWNYTAVGIGTVDGKEKVVLAVNNSMSIGFSPDKARYLAMQLLMTADQIDKCENECDETSS